MQPDWNLFVDIVSPILITGNTGTGKSTMARALFEHSSLHRSSFHTAHLASLKEELMESELFGHHKGAFTGAIEHRIGYLQATGSGTLFLDEVGELSLEAQKKLLYLLEEKKYVPVGSTSERIFSGRLILATNKDLAGLVEKGLFRQDLYFRLMLFELRLLDLKDLPVEELKKIIHQEFEVQKKRYQKKEGRLSSELVDYLCHYPWPGNYRELKNCCEFLVVMGQSSLCECHHLPGWLAPRGASRSILSCDAEEYGIEDYHRALGEFEARYLRRWLKLKGGKINQTAKDLGISKTALIYKCKQYNLFPKSLNQAS